MKKTNIRRKDAARDLAYIALSISLITVCAFISIPFGTIPVTLQTLGVALVGALLGWKRALFSVFAYLVMGLLGIPVFSGFRAGAAALFGPTGGYLLGFIFLALFPALIKRLPVQNQRFRFFVFLLSMLFGLAVCYFFGSVWYMQMLKCDWRYALTFCVFPFLLPDLIKLSLAAFLAVRLEKRVG